LISVLGVPAGAAAKAGPSKADYVAGEVITKFKPNVSGAQRAEVRRSLGLKLKRSLPVPGTQELAVPSGMTVSAAVSGLEASGSVVYAEPNFKTEYRTIPNDPLFQYQWDRQNLGAAIPNYTGTVTADADVDAPEAWNITTGSPSVKIAILDSGIAYNHEDLAPNIWSNPGETGTDGSGHAKASNGIDDDSNGYVDDWRGWNFALNSNDPIDTAGHGTAVAGVAAAKANNGLGIAGMAWNSTIMPIQSGGNTGSEALGIAYAKNAGAAVVNMSFGTPGQFSQALEDAMASAPRMLFVAAADEGGANKNSDTYDDWPCNSTLKNVICVTSSTPADTLDPDTNYGATTVDLAAPSMYSYTTVLDQQYKYLQGSGTSLATPVVSGVAALLKSVAPLASPSQLRQALIAGVDTIPSMAGKTVSGGRLNALKAIQAIQGYGITTDTTGPSPQISFPRNGTWMRAVDSVRWGDSGTSVNTTCVIDGAAPVACSSPLSRSWTNGAHTVAVTEVDSSGNSATSTVMFSTESLNQLVVNPSAPTGTVRTSRPTIHFTASAPSGIWVNYGIPYTLCVPDGNLAATFNCVDGSLPPTFSNGTHTIEVQAMSTARNFLTSAPLTFTVDTKPTITSPAADGTVSTLSSVSGTAEPGATVKVYTGGTDLRGTTTANGAGAWTANIGTLSGATWVITATGTDAAGNVSPTSAPRTMVVDVTPPTVSISAPANGALTSSTSPTLSFTATDASSHTEQCQIDGAAWAACPSTIGPLSVGQHTVTVRSTDVVGNVSTATTSFNVVTLSSLTPPSTENIATVGTVDWSHWGLTTSTSWDHKSTGGSKIGNLTQVSSSGLTRVTSGVTPSVSWSGGTPTASSAGTATGITNTTSGVGKGFAFTVAAQNTSTVTLRVHVGVLNSQGKLELFWSSNPSKIVTDTSLSTSSTTTPANRVFQIALRAPSASDTLNVRWTQNTSPSGSTSKVRVYSATAG
jgi:subtilisin family serine protease